MGHIRRIKTYSFQGKVTPTSVLDHTVFLQKDPFTNEPESVLIQIKSNVKKETLTGGKFVYNFEIPVSKLKEINDKI